MASSSGKQVSLSDEEAEHVIVRRPPQPSRPDLTMEALGARVTWIEEEIGEPPHPLRNHPGSGLWQAMHNVGDEIRALADEVRELRRTRELEHAAEKALAEQRAAASAPYSRVAWIAIGAAITALVGGGVAALLVWLSGFHR